MTTASTAGPLLGRRDAQGRIVALSRQPLGDAEAQAGGWQPVAAADPEVERFMREVASQGNPLSQTDAGLGRVTEDLINVLIDRGVIQFTDLPAAAQAKLLARRQTRAELTKRLDLLDADGDSEVL